jgi:hypothetical protein
MRQPFSSVNIAKVQQFRALLSLPREVNSQIVVAANAGPKTTGAGCYVESLLQFFAKSIHQGLWIPARAEPVIGRLFAPTRWLGRDDDGDFERYSRCDTD